MFALVVAVAAAILLTPPSYAQNAFNHKYTVWSSVIFARTGERTPVSLGNLQTGITTLGSQQMYSVGQFFRERYLTSLGSTDGIGSAPIQGMDPNEIDNDQLYVIALDQQYNVASAQAFVQGLYPPHSLSGNSTEIAGLLDPTSVLSNNTYIEAPMGGYQYAQIHTADAYDLEFPYIGAQIGCPAWAIAAQDTFNTPEFKKTLVDSQSIYDAVGPVLLADVLSPESWSYYNAYPIYDYVSFMNEHNTTVAALLEDPRYISPDTNISFLDQLRWYADSQQYSWLATMDAHNNITDEPLPGDIVGSISTIPGNMLAAKLLSQLETNVAEGGLYYKLNLIFGDYQPLVSLFTLMDLPDLNSHFYGLPDFGSVATLELFSYTTANDSNLFPNSDDLWVRFYFRNGTADDSEYLAYSLFENGPSSMDMRWPDFQQAMNNILISDLGTWCTQCGAELLFCAAWNSSNAVDSESSEYRDRHHGGPSPAVSGVIGAIVTLVVAGLLFGLAMLLGGVRMHRVQTSRRGDLGGFKGGQKMRSDEDLTIPKGGAVVGATVESPSSPQGGHERVGSWEMKSKEAEIPNMTTAGGELPPRLSFEDDDIGTNPFRDPVKADERV